MIGYNLLTVFVILLKTKLLFTLLYFDLVNNNINKIFGIFALLTFNELP